MNAKVEGEQWVKNLTGEIGLDGIPQDELEWLEENSEDEAERMLRN